MARSRNIKPGFFTHEQMAENDPLARLLFLGLTTIADFKGELEWRPKRIKVQLLPYDDCDVEKLAINLERSGFIRFYSRADISYVHIVNFTKHQNPHKNERDAGSEIPKYSAELRQVVDSTSIVIKTEQISINREQDGTTPADSFNLIPDSLNPICSVPAGDQQADAPSNAKRKTRLPADFDLTIERRAAAQTYWQQNQRHDLSAITEFERFVAHHQSHGSVMANWGAAWKTWYCNAIKFNRPMVSGNGQTRFDSNGNQQRDNSAAGRVAANIARERAEREAASQELNREFMAADGADVRPQVDHQLRGPSGPGQRLGCVLEGDFSRAD